MDPRVLVVGSINMDLIARCKRAPREGETIHGETFHTAPGGKGANQAVACARLGGATHMVGRVGGDEFGRSLRLGLAESGVDVEHVGVDPQTSSGVAVILLEETGRNRIIVIAGANWRVGDDEVRAAGDLLSRADVVLMQFEVPLAVVKAVAEAAREKEVLSVLDAGAATPAAAEMGLPGLVDVISPNETEAETLTGVKIHGLPEARRAAEALREMGAREVVLKLGEQGAYWMGTAGEGHFPAFPVEPVDTTAAGDAFTGCLSVALAGGAAMHEAIARANAAGALACLTLGAQPSMPTAEAVDAFLQAHMPES